MPERPSSDKRPSSDRGRLLQVGAAGVLAAALGISYCFGAKACALSEAGDMDIPSDAPEAGDEPTSPNLIGKLHNTTVAIPEEIRAIKAERDLYRKAVLNMASQPDLSYKPFNWGVEIASPDPTL